MTNKDLNLEMVELFGNNRNDEGTNKPSSMSPFMDQVHFATCSPKKNRNMKKRHYNVSPDGVSSLDEYTTTTITYDTHTPSGGRRMSITISDGNSSEISSEPVLIAESLENSSLITQSTNSRTTASTLPSPSSGHSLATTATCKTRKYKNMGFDVLNETFYSHTQAGNTLDSKQSQVNRPKSLCQKIGEETNDVITSQENLNVDLHRRRHAINITSNPGYRVGFVPRLLVR